MISNVKLNSKNKPAKSSAKKVKNPEKLQMKDKAKEGQSLSQNDGLINKARDIASADQDLDGAADEYLGNELYTLRYDINERGIGKILLPPSLSTLLQSDRVCISPTAGGLFIKSL